MERIDETTYRAMAWLMLRPIVHGVMDDWALHDANQRVFYAVADNDWSAEQLALVASEADRLAAAFQVIAAQARASAERLVPA